MERRRVSLTTLGCKLNATETSSLAEDFRRYGWDVVPFGSDADVVVVNTCTVTANADAECRNAVRRGRRHAPQSKVIVTGCSAQLRPESLASIDGVVAVVGTRNKLTIADHIESYVRRETPLIDVEEITADDFRGAVSSPDDGRTRTHLKIQDGCDYSCSFCTIPDARGPARAMPFEDVLKTLQDLDGHTEEVVLTGINLGEYRSGTHRFVDVVRGINELRPSYRVRLSSIEPNTLTDDIIDCITSSRTFCPHLHIPLQSGSASVLRRMRRRYTPELYERRILDVVSRRADVCIGIDVIVGFPGETEAEFAETMNFLEQLPWSYLHVFTYSERPNTAALQGEPVPADVRRLRMTRLRDLSARRYEEWSNRYIGQHRSAIVEAFDETAQAWPATTDNYIKVYLTTDVLRGKRIDVEIGPLVDGYRSARPVGEAGPLPSSLELRVLS